ncbi:hypothetical protein RFY44_10205 [Acinetobacter bereziniae]|uniref:hypothetical protein n=1 Tax=Acinetobacter bereziniae TaxID=106648 RepID=UPI001116DE6A|nr:hypothetical protein [Acinetobacter bereziniae]MDQ9819253.1 hypothetical protein [Acinetobacter bereziniae]TNL40917.1 hypothetical protein EYB59_23245 [Acinetobacter bereziniae]TNL45658.1 hypothetical protein EYY58_22970 [Acinetobacter bereziniae]
MIKKLRFKHKDHENMQLRINFAIEAIGDDNFLVEIQHFHSKTDNTFDFELPSWLNLHQYQLKNVDYADLNRAYKVDKIDFVFLLSAIFVIANQSNYRFIPNKK